MLGRVLQDGSRRTPGSDPDASSLPWKNRRAALSHILLLTDPEVRGVDVASPTEKRKPSSAEVVDDSSTSTEYNPVAPIANLPPRIKGAGAHR